MTSEKSYGRILKSSSIMGGSAGIVMLLSMVRTKFAAVLIGTTGAGLLANFGAIQGMVGTIAGLGIGSSAVRDVAAAVAKRDEQAIGRAVLTLRRMSWLTGLLGMVAMMVLSPLLSRWTFGSSDYTLEIASLGFIILFANIAAGQTALIRGMRRIGDMARLTIIGTSVGTLLSIGFYFWLGLRGIVPALVLTSAVQLVASWRYARQVPVPSVGMTWRESFYEARDMVKLGIAMMWTGLIGSLSAYVIITMITQQINLQAVGIYSAAYALSGMFVNFVLQAMGADYYPRLTAVADDKDAMNRLVNEQTEIGLLLAVPGLLATLSFAPWIIHIFYTKEFLPAADLLQWFVLGCLGRVISWPMGFLMLAMGKSVWWFMTQTIFTMLQVGLSWVGITIMELEGVSIAFFVLYIVVLGVTLYMAKQLTNYSYSLNVSRMLIVLMSVIAMVFVGTRLLSMWPATVSGAALTIITSVWCLRGLVHRIGSEHRLTLIVHKIPGLRMACGLPKG